MIWGSLYVYTFTRADALDALCIFFALGFPISIHKAIPPFASRHWWYGDPGRHRLISCGNPTPQAAPGDSVGLCSLGHEHPSAKAAADTWSALCLFGLSTTFRRPRIFSHGVHRWRAVA